jgi:toxin ParE1/3/4
LRTNGTTSPRPNDGPLRPITARSNRPWRYLGLHGRPIDQAETYTRDLWQRIEAVAARPAMGQECSDIRAGYYKISCGSHFLFYRLIADGIDIVRILHERMDFARHIP